jgi:protocatechuate 3,4-dioxygenase beta subunit
VDFWHADDRGDYDNTGFRLRGHQFTDSAGRHFHMKVQAANQPVLTTQLYFPGEPRNQADRIFNPKLVMTVRDTASGKVATFNFILRLQ